MSTHLGRAALVCYRDHGRVVDAEWTIWNSREQAEQARAELAPCGPYCIGVHSIVAIGHETTGPLSRHREVARTRSRARAATVAPWSRGVGQITSRVPVRPSS